MTEDSETTSGLQEVFRGSPPTAPPLVVMEFAEGAKQPAIEWMISRLQMSRVQGGAELDVTAMVMHHKKVSGLHT